MLRKKEQDLRQQAISSNQDDVVHGWIRAMFNQMDTNGDGKISLNEMKSYAEKMNLDRGYVKDFSEYVHIKAGDRRTTIIPRWILITFWRLCNRETRR